MDTLTKAFGIAGLVLTTLTGCSPKKMDAPILSDYRKINSANMGNSALVAIDVDHDGVVDVLRDNLSTHNISYFNPGSNLSETVKIEWRIDSNTPRMTRSMADAANEVLRNYQFLIFKTALMAYNREKARLAAVNKSR